MSIRLQALDLLFGSIGGELEYAFAGPVSIGLAPQYIFADWRQNSSIGLKGKGSGVTADLGFWIEGRPLRGYFLKARLSYSSVTFKSYQPDGVTELATEDVPETILGVMFGSQSIYAGWFTVSGGFGIGYNLKNEVHRIAVADPYYGPIYELPGPGLISGNGFVLIPELSLGGSF
jgi:hypothetical protein